MSAGSPTLRTAHRDRLPSSALAADRRRRHYPQRTKGRSRHRRGSAPFLMHRATCLASRSAPPALASPRFRIASSPLKRRHRQLPRISLFPASRPTPPTSDRLELCSATPRSLEHIGCPHLGSLATRYLPHVRQRSLSARPVLRTGRRALFRRARLRHARLHEARFAVFALRVTIPVAFAPFGRCALRLRVRSANAVHDRRRGSVAPPPLSFASPTFGGSHSSTVSQQARR